MMATTQEKKLYGNHIQVLKRCSSYIQYKVTDKTGEGILTAYDVFPGIRLLYNEMHMQTCSVDSHPPENFIEINHCREGQIELLFDHGSYLYLTKGDLSVSIKDGRSQSSSFPLSHYHGMSIELDMTKASKCLACILDDVSFNFEKLLKKLSENDNCIIIRNVESFEHIFSELYSISDNMRIGYYKIKVLEILFFLCGFNLDDIASTKKYYSRFQVETAKQIKDYLNNHWSSHITLNDLSEKFCISLTTMKKSFQSLFEISIYAYLRNLRMQKAAMLLTQTDATILSISTQVGYDNASKFSSAFRSVMGQLPSDYRKSNLPQTSSN